MGILLERQGDKLELNHTFWAYLLNLGEIYGWQPKGTAKPKGYGIFKSWLGNYDSSDGQMVTATDAANLAKSLKAAAADKDFSQKSDELRASLKKAIEEGLGKKIEYEILPDVEIETITDIADFIHKGEFKIN